MKPGIKVYLLDEEGRRFFGDGPCRLLQLVEELGSLRSAANDMGMAYTKAIKLIKQTEKAIGCPVTERAVGGSGGGGSRLTKRGKELVEQYEAYKALCVQANEASYLEIFGSHR